MIRKLMKHEIIASYRTYLPIYAALLLLSGFIAISNRLDNQTLLPLLVMLLSMTVGAVVIFTIYNLIISLGVRVYGKPGYLLFSTPAKTTDIFIAKFVINFMWILCTTIISILSIGLTVYFLGAFDEVVDVIKQVWMVIDLSSLDIFTFAASAFVSVLYTLSVFTFLFALLNLIYKGEKKVLIGFIFYFVLNLILNQINTALTQPITQSFMTTGSISTSGYWYMIMVQFVMSAALVGTAYYFVSKKFELQ